eukprot:CAMPEP_0197188246 /NCGR_PEP_ID=MMETSP1423-20130617/17511_1 /TAXON_ID=476441 /ORGANISM="Pseudo-nitzschia heimii, Strain UNC1101" /LENGTH=387 /DNA_ID=CAMNT_0042640041 /DNA_START=207 /DNA_END=1370 /DNA_ORIENTATION=+
MDSPHGVPEASSPVVLLPASNQFSLAIGGPEVATDDATRTSARLPVIAHQSRTRSTAAVSGSIAAVRTNNSFSVGVGAHDQGTEASGPTRRSRRRLHSSTRERSTGATAFPQAASVPSRKRKAQSSPQRAISKKKSNKTNSRKKPPPGPALKKDPEGKSDSKDDFADSKPAAVESCCICMCDVEPNDLAKIDGCDHRFCFGCIEKWSERENTCPLCKARFTKIERVNKKRKKGIKNTKKVKHRDQRTDVLPGAAAIEGLFANLNRYNGPLSTPLGRLVFSAEFGGFNAAGRPTHRVAFSTTHTANEADSEEDDSPMAAFMRALHGGPAANAVNMATTVVNRPVTVTAHFTTTTRSFARNVHDSTAGVADNPLEIDDDSVEEVIEIDD